MASVLFQAIGRGYHARSILSAISKQAPKYQNFINNAYLAGYTAESILSRVAKSKDGKNYDPDQFLTEHEKVQRRDLSQKRNASMKLLAAAGTTAAVVGGAAYGAYELMKRNRSPQAIRPNAILPPLPQQRQIGGRQQQLAIGHQAHQQQQPQPQQPGPVQPMPMAPQPQQQSPQAQPQPQPPPQDLTKTVDLLKGLKEDRRLSNLIDGGFDLQTTTALFRASAPKNVLSILEKADGGLEKVVDDYKRFLDESQARQQQQAELSKPTENFAEMTRSTMGQPKPEEQTDVMNEFMKASQAQSMQPQAQQQQSMQPTQNAQQPTASPIEQIAPQMNAPSPPKPLVSLKNGQIGQVEQEKNNVATVNVNGNIRKEKMSELGKEPPETEEAVRSIINSIPENMKSTAVQSMVHIPGLNIMLSQFYDGKWAYYLDMPEDVYQSVALGTYAPKGQATTGIGEYKPGVADSRGAGFHQEIKVNPKYNKENKGKTWGYATNEYSLLHNIQSILHKISKERYDEQGNIIIPKTRTKKRPD